MRYKVLLLRLKVKIHHARLDVRVVLVFAAVVAVIVSEDAVVIDLTDLRAGVDADGLDAEDLQRPVPGEADVAEAGRHRTPSQT